MEKKVNIKIDTDVWKKIKSQSALEEKTINQGVVDVLAREIKKCQ